MSDALQIVSILTSLLQAGSNSIQAAAMVSGMLTNMLNEGREEATPEEWQRIDDFVAAARKEAQDSVS